MAESHEGVACHRKSQKDKNGQQIVLYPNPRSFRLASPPHQTYTPNNEHLVPEMDRLPTTNFSVALLLGTWISTICRLQILSTWIHMYIMYIMYMSCVCFPGSLSLETLRLQLQGHQTWSAPSNQVTNTTTDWHPPRISGWCPRRTLAFKENFLAIFQRIFLGPAGRSNQRGRDLPPGVPTKTNIPRPADITATLPRSDLSGKLQDTRMTQNHPTRKGEGKISSVLCTYIFNYIVHICIYFFVFKYTYI